VCVYIEIFFDTLALSAARWDTLVLKSSIQELFLKYLIPSRSLANSVHPLVAELQSPLIHTLFSAVGVCEEGASVW